MKLQGDAHWQGSDRNDTENHLSFYSPLPSSQKGREVTNLALSLNVTSCGTLDARTIIRLTGPEEV